MAVKKRVLFRHLRNYDMQYSQEIVRRLEMVVDGAIVNPGYIVQFWRDVTVYGVDEAILYVKNGGYGNHEVIQKEWDKLQQEFKWDSDKMEYVKVGTSINYNKVLEK